MKKWLWLLACVPFFALGQAKWQEGVHYTVIAEKPSEAPEILEFFSFWCPHCYNFEPIVAEIKKRLPANVRFEKVHVNFMGFTTQAIQDDATRGMLVARSLGLEEDYNRALFARLHQQRQAVEQLAQVSGFLSSQGISPQKFVDTAESFAIASQWHINNKLLEKYRQHLRGVPNFIVNGKYQAILEGLTAEEYVQLILWLAEQK